MSVFSERLAISRKEKNISQKVAAADLGVSQALLSHYEKGIRECSPSFIAKAAAYYDVSADYLLGLSDRTNNMNAVFAEEEQPLDGEIVAQTVYRALVRLNREAAKISPECAARVMNAYEFALYKLLYAFTESGILADSPLNIKRDTRFVSSVAETAELNGLERALEKTAVSLSACPLCIQTVVKHCENRIRVNIDSLKTGQ